MRKPLQEECREHLDKSIFVLMLAVVALAVPVSTFAEQTCTIDHVINGWGLDSIMADSQVEFVLRVTNTPGDGHFYNPSMSFRIYSPDGAVWTADLPSLLSSIAPQDTMLFDTTFITAIGSAGSPDDQVGFAGVGRIGNDGKPSLYDGFDDNLLSIKLTPSASSLGRHICIEPLLESAPQGFEWSWWAFCDWPNASPVWGNQGAAYCFKIGQPYVSGQDLAVSIGATRAVPDHPFRYGVTYFNKGGTTVNNATVSLALPSQVVYADASAGGYYQSGPHTISWLIPELTPGDTNWIWAECQVPLSVPVGTSLTTMATIEPISTDAFPWDNVRTINREVLASFDPCEKLVTPKGEGSGGEIHRTDTLHYQISFQNVGMIEDSLVVVRDSLDADLDSNSLQIGASSHPCVFHRYGAELVWSFENIRLPNSLTDEPGSQGFVTFDVIPRPEVPYGTEIENKAVIYLNDYPGVTTNVTRNTIIGCCGVYTAGYTGNTDCDGDGKMNLQDVTRLIDRIYLSQTPLCCEENGDTNGDGSKNLQDVTRLIDHIYLSKNATAACQ